MVLEYDKSKEAATAALMDRIIGNPNIVRKIADEIRAFVDPRLPALDELLADEEAALRWSEGEGLRGWPDGQAPDESIPYRHVYAMTNLVHALAKEECWWVKHFPEGVKPGPYPKGQARCLVAAVDWLRLAGNVELPEHLVELSLFSLRPEAQDPQG